MKLLFAAFALTLPSTSVGFSPGPTSLVTSPRTKALEMSWLDDFFAHRSDNAEEMRQSILSRFRKRTIKDAMDAGAKLEGAKEKITWEVKDDGLFGFVPTKEMTGVEPYITQFCSTFSKQLYDCKSSDQFKVSTKDHKGELLIFDDHGKLAEATPPFGVLVVGDTMIIGWRGTNSLNDLVNDAANSPQSSFAWRKHAKTIKLQGAMTSIVQNDLVQHETEIIKEIQDRGIKEVVVTGQSLGGGCCQIGHLIIRAQMEDEQSPWNVLEGVNVRSVGFCAPMTISLENNASPETDDFLKDVNDNSCNMIFSNDVVPRGYGYMSFIDDFVDDSIPDLTNNLPVPKIAKMIFDVRGKLESGFDTFQDVDQISNFIDICTNYRHLGNQIYYETEDSKPRVLRDMGAFYKNPDGKTDILRDVKYKPVDNPMTEFMGWHMNIIGNGAVYGPNPETERCGLCYPADELS